VGFPLLASEPVDVLFGWAALAIGSADRPAAAATPAPIRISRRDVAVFVVRWLMGFSPFDA
jgi:hypothetical protein